LVNKRSTTMMVTRTVSSTGIPSIRRSRSTNEPVKSSSNSVTRRVSSGSNNSNTDDARRVLIMTKAAAEEEDREGAEQGSDDDAEHQKEIVTTKAIEQCMDNLVKLEEDVRELRMKMNAVLINSAKTPKDILKLNAYNGSPTSDDDVSSSTNNKNGQAPRMGAPANNKNNTNTNKDAMMKNNLKKVEEESKKLSSQFTSEVQKMMKKMELNNMIISSSSNNSNNKKKKKDATTTNNNKNNNDNNNEEGKTALMNLNCVENNSPLFVLVFHHEHNSTQQAGIYSLQEKATPDELPVDTILAFMTKSDAERYAKLLKSSLGTVPIVESVTKSELALTCRIGGHRCVVSSKGYELAPPRESLKVTDWERSNMLRSGSWKVVGEDETCTISSSSEEGDDFSLDWKSCGMEIVSSMREEAKRERIESARERLEKLYKKGTLGENNNEEQ
jgi:hypothetical protein